MEELGDWPSLMVGCLKSMIEELIPDPCVMTHLDVDHPPLQVGHNDFLLLNQHNLTVRPGTSEILFCGTQIDMRKECSVFVLQFDHLFVRGLEIDEGRLAYCKSDVYKSGKQVYVFLKIDNNTRYPFVFKKGEPVVRIKYADRYICNEDPGPERTILPSLRSDTLALLKSEAWKEFENAPTFLRPFSSPLLDPKTFINFKKVTFVLPDDNGGFKKLSLGDNDGPEDAEEESDTGSDVEEGKVLKKPRGDDPDEGPSAAIC